MPTHYDYTQLPTELRQQLEGHKAAIYTSTITENGGEWQLIGGGLLTAVAAGMSLYVGAGVGLLWVWLLMDWWKKDDRLVEALEGTDLDEFERYVPDALKPRFQKLKEQIITPATHTPPALPASPTEPLTTDTGLTPISDTLSTIQQRLTALLGTSTAAPTTVEPEAEEVQQDEAEDEEETPWAENTPAQFTPDTLNLLIVQQALNDAGGKLPLPQLMGKLQEHGVEAPIARLHLEWLEKQTLIVVEDGTAYTLPALEQEASKPTAQPPAPAPTPTTPTIAAEELGVRAVQMAIALLPVPQFTTQDGWVSYLGKLKPLIQSNAAMIYPDVIQQSVVYKTAFGTACLQEIQKHQPPGFVEFANNPPAPPAPQPEAVEVEAVEPESDYPAALDQCKDPQWKKKLIRVWRYLAQGCSLKDAKRKSSGGSNGLTSADFQKAVGILQKLELIPADLTE